MQQPTQPNKFKSQLLPACVLVAAIGVGWYMWHMIPPRYRNFVLIDYQRPEDANIRIHYPVDSEMAVCSGWLGKGPAEDYSSAVRGRYNGCELRQRVNEGSLFRVYIDSDAGTEVHDVPATGTGGRSHQMFVIEIDSNGVACNATRCTMCP